jgi:hypothetical protein
MRRAIEAYATHVESLMRLPDQHEDPRTDRELAEGLERTRLRAAGRDLDLGVPIEAVEGKPVRPLSELVRDAYAVPQERPIDRIRRELRLAPLKNDNDEEDDDDGAMCTL